MQILMKHAPQGLPKHAQLRGVLEWADAEFKVFSTQKKKSKVIRDSADKWKTMATALRERHESQHVQELSSSKLQELVDNVVIYSVEMWCPSPQQEIPSGGIAVQGDLCRLERLTYIVYWPTSHLHWPNASLLSDRTAIWLNFGHSITCTSQARPLTPPELG